MIKVELFYIKKEEELQETEFSVKRIYLFGILLYYKIKNY